MVVAVTPRATLDDLMRVEGKAELIGGRIVPIMPTGDLPSSVAFRIATRLDHHARQIAKGVAHPDGVGYAIPELQSGRESFSPDASYYDGKRPKNRMRFIEGPPTFAAEVRSETDYGIVAEDQMASKRADYFEAGTQVIWDVDPIAETVTAYRSGDPANPTVYKRGEVADAEPAVPGWRIAVDDIFDV